MSLDGLPAVDVEWRSFASRMASALLTAAGLSELIATTLAQYKAIALALATDPARCLSIRDRLRVVRQEGALFDTAQFARALEDRCWTWFHTCRHQIKEFESHETIHATHRVTSARSHDG